MNPAEPRFPSSLALASSPRIEHNGLPCAFQTHRTPKELHTYFPLNHTADPRSCARLFTTHLTLALASSRNLCRCGPAAPTLMLLERSPLPARQRLVRAHARPRHRRAPPPGIGGHPRRPSAGIPAGHRRAPLVRSAAARGATHARMAADDAPQASYKRWFVEGCPFAAECSASSWSRLKGSGTNFHPGNQRKNIQGIH